MREAEGDYTHTHEGSVNIEAEFFFNSLLKVINFRLHWVFIAVRRLSLVAASRGYPLVAASRGYPPVAASRGYPLVAASRGYALVAACGLFTVMASLVEHRF